MEPIQQSTIGCTASTSTVSNLLKQAVLFMGRALKAIGVPNSLSGLVTEKSQATKVVKKLWARKKEKLTQQDRPVKLVPSSSTGNWLWDLLGYGDSYIPVYFSKNKKINLNGKISRTKNGKEDLMYVFNNCWTTLVPSFCSPW